MSSIDTPFRSPGDGHHVSHGSPQQATPLAATRLHYELADEPGADHGSHHDDPAARRAARLYTTRDQHFRQLDQQRMAAERERAEAELRGATFAPAISSRSRQLVHDDARPASERLFEDAMQRKYRQGRLDASQHSSRSASMGPADHSGVPSSIHPSNVSNASSAADAGENAALPRVAREYHVAAVEHDWHVELLRAEQREKEAAMCAPVRSRTSPPRGPAPGSLPAPTRADDFRAAAARAKIDRDRAARRNPLEDATHRKRNEALMQEAQARAARAKEREADRLARKAAGAVGPSPEPDIKKKQSRADVAAVSQRLFKEAEARARRQQESELAERAAAQKAKAAAEKRRQDEYQRMKAAHDVALRAAAEAAPASAASTLTAEEAPATAAQPEHPDRAKPTTSTEPRRQEVPEGTPLRKRAAVPVAASVVSSALLKRRQEAAAEGVKERRLKAEAMRKAKEAEAKAIAERSQRLPLRPRPGAVRSSSTTTAARAHAAEGPAGGPSEPAVAAADAPRTTVDTSTTLKPRARRASSADGARPAAAADAQAPVIKGMDAYRLRREKAEAMRREAEAKLHVNPSAVRRVRRADGKLVTHCDPFDNLERHEQASYERRIAVVEGHLAQEGPYAPTTVGDLYQPPAPAPSTDTNRTIPSSGLPSTVQSRGVSVPSSVVSGAIPH